MRLLLVLFGVLSVLALGRFAINIVTLAGYFNKLEPKLVEQCTRVDIAPGAEDVAIDPSLNAAFVSAGDRRSWYSEANEKMSPSNGVYLMDLTPPHAVKRVSPEGFPDFLPHGINLWVGPDGEKRLFVVNHPTTGEEIVEIFKVKEDGALEHLRSVSFDAMYSPNDVVGVGAEAFYATNDRRYEEGILSFVESYLAMPMTDVVFFDGEEGRVAAKGLMYANGINRSADGAQIYVAEVVGRRFTVFDRDATSNELARVKSLKLNTAPDNVNVAPNGDLLTGGHSKIFQFIEHADDASAIAPSHVVRVDPVSGAREDVFIDTSGKLNASSVAAATEDLLIVGGVFDGHVLVCPL